MNLIQRIKRSNPGLKKKQIVKVLDYLGYSKEDMTTKKTPARAVGVLFFYLPSTYLDNERFKRPKKDTWE